MVSNCIADPLGPQYEVTGIPAILRQELKQHGVISAARFMEIALYCPKMGYYEKSAGQVGRRGDFHTSVSVGRLFGELLARQFAEWLEALGPGSLHLVEAGAHDGQLAFDILNWLAAHRPALFGRIAYWLIEPSVDRQNRQRLKLENYAQCVDVFAGWHAVPRDGVRGVIFSNELLDAMPVHRLRWDAPEQRWSEWGVGWCTDRFVWRRMESAQNWKVRLAEAGFELPAQLMSVLPDGFTLEVSPRAGEWWSDAANALCAGKLLTLDYGLTALEFLDPARAAGTLRGYARQRLQEDVLANPGEQDITAHVNFTQLQLAGERAGLRTVTLTDQERFLSRIAVEASAGDEHWSPKEVRQFQTLAHPGQMGHAFRVLVQESAGT